MSEVQSVLFEKKYWTLRSAADWLVRHNLWQIKKVHETKNFYRFRLHEPKNYKRIRILKTKKHLGLLIGFPA
jgi:hypothetical protein